MPRSVSVLKLISSVRENTGLDEQFREYDLQGATVEDARGHCVYRCERRDLGA